MKDEIVFNVNSNNLLNSDDLEVEGGAPRPIGFVYVENEYVEELEKKAKAFDEVKKYTLNNHDEFEDRKDRARNHIEYDYFSALQIANRAVINKCKQLEDLK